MPEGGDCLAAVMKMMDDFILIDGTDPNQTEIEADDCIDCRDQAVFDGESGQTLDHTGTGFGESDSQQ